MIEYVSFLTKLHVFLLTWYCLTVAKCGLKSMSSDVERCLSLVRYDLFLFVWLFFLGDSCATELWTFNFQCVEERMRGLISSLIRLSKQVNILLGLCEKLIVFFLWTWDRGLLSVESWHWEVKTQNNCHLRCSWRNHVNQSKSPGRMGKETSWCGETPKGKWSELSFFPLWAFFN